MKRHYTSLAEYFKISPKKFYEIGVLNPLIDKDIKLFIDPRLLKKSKYEIFNKNAVNTYETFYKNLAGHIKAYLKITDEDIFQLIFFIDRDREDLVANALEGCVLSRWNDSAVDATSPLAGKDRGVKALLEKFGYGDENCIVFGDGGNDIPMLRAFENSVAMGNASDEVREAAGFVTSHIDEDGVLNALRHFGVIS